MRWQGQDAPANGGDGRSWVRSVVLKPKSAGTLWDTVVIVAMLL